MASSDGSIILETKVDESGISSGMGKIKSGAAKLGKGVAVAGAAATAAFVGISKAAMGSYADYEQLTGGVETLFKTSSDAVMNYANQAYQTAGMSANQYMETVTSFSASLLQSLGGDTAKAAEAGNQAVIDMSDNANKMGTSMESIQNAYQGFAKQNFTMLDNLKLGYGGTKTEMERLLADAEKIKAANGEMASYSIDSFADITEAIHVVQTEMGITGTTADEAATTIQGSLKMAKGAWENLLTGMSDTNADVEDLTEKFIDSIETVYGNLEPVIERTLNSLPKLVTKLGTKLLNAVPGIFKTISPKVLSGITELIKAIINTVAKNAVSIADTIVEMGKIIVTTIVSLVPQMITAGGQLIKGLVQGIAGQMPVLSTAAMAITAVFAAIKIVNVVQSIISGFSAINTALNAYTTACAASQSVSVLLATTMTPLQLAVGVLTGKVSLATVAQAAWNAVMNLNPAILITTAIVGLTAAVVGAVVAYDAYIAKHSEVVIASQNMADASAKAAEKAQEHANNMAKLGETAAQTIEDAEAEAYANRILADELYNLAEQSSLTVQQKERMRDIVNELNGNIDGLNLQLDEETGALNLTREAMDEYITKSLEVAKAKAVQELYTASLKEQYKAQSQMKQAAADYSAAQEELNKYMVDGMNYSQSYAAHGLETRKVMANLRTVIDNSTKAFNTNMTACQDAQAELQSIAEVTGVEMPQGFDVALQEFAGMTEGMISKCKNTSDQSSGLGQDFGSGYSKGIGKARSEAYIQAYYLAQAALKGVKDGQRSNSPAKETIKLGDYFDEGYIKGITNGFDKAENSGKKLAEKALKGAKTGTKETSTEITKAFKSLTDDTRSEVRKVFDEWEDEEKDVLWIEQRYADESLRIEKEREEKEWQSKLDSAKKSLEEDKKKAKNSAEIQEAEAKYEEKIQELHNERMEKEQKEAEDNYLTRLKQNAEKVRKIVEAERKDAENLKNSVINAYKEMSEAAISDIENLKKTQDTFATKLKNYGDLYNERRTADGKTYKSLADIGKTNKTLEKYYETLMKIKERGDVPAEFFENLRDMGVDEGLEYANKLLRLNDKQWDKYLADWEEKQEISERISKDIYKDEAAQLAAEVNDKFEAVEKEFFGVGETAADNFESGFMDELKSVIENIKSAINGAFSSVAIPMPALQEAGIVTQGAQLNIPAMASGGIVPRAMTALIGEKGKEAVLPLENNTGWMDILADKVAQRNGGQVNQVIREEHYNLNQTELMTVLYKLVKGGERLKGTSLIG